MMSSSGTGRYMAFPPSPSHSLPHLSALRSPASSAIAEHDKYIYIFFPLFFIIFEGSSFAIIFVLVFIYLFIFCDFFYGQIGHTIFISVTCYDACYSWIDDWLLDCWFWYVWSDCLLILSDPFCWCKSDWKKLLWWVFGEWWLGLAIDDSDFRV